MKRYLTKRDAQKFLKWLETLKEDDCPKYSTKNFKPANKGDYAYGQAFFKPSGQLAFGYEINGARTETTVFTDLDAHLVEFKIFH